jgi:hypothetical protein
MTPYKANPFGFIFSIAAVAAVGLYYLYGAVDHLGVEERSTPATVVGKQFTESGKSYYTTIAGGRAWVQSQQTPETYAVVLDVGAERTAGVASKAIYDSLQPGDRVQARTRRTRITGRLEVVEIAR